MNTDWASLADGILDSVFKRIDSPSDYLRSSVVCKSWHRVSLNNRVEQAKLMSNSNHPPMLLFPADEEGTEDKVFAMQVTVPPNYKWFCGSSKGWLIALDENFVVTLINPLARVKGMRAKENSIIKLPPLDMKTFVWSNKKKNCLGGLSLFLGDNSTIAVEASKFPGCKSDCIYFNHDYDGNAHDYPPYDYGVYDYKTNAFTNPYDEEVKTQLKSTIREPIWILPTFHL